MFVQYHNHVKKLHVVGDVHGCLDELKALLNELGYAEDGNHPDGYKLAFVGDLMDRGPQNVAATLFVMALVKAGKAFAVRGNHCDKFARYLNGNDVKVGNGLQGTLDELATYSDDVKDQLRDFLNDLPFVNMFDDGKLMVCHAAPPKSLDADSNKKRKRNEALCLYGHVTGKKDANGYPERLDWAPAYDANADENTPFVTYGHVCHAEAYVLNYSACLDTACFAGNKLTAMEWPSRKLTSVQSNQQWDADRNLVLADQKECLIMRQVKASPITTYNLNTLLERFRENEEDILYLIDTDPLLKHREHEGMVIANASKALFEPELEHQLFAKGIVYQRDPYRLVSLPLVKMHNWGMKEASDKECERLEEECEIHFLEKADGVMIQAFSHEGQVYFSTRSMLGVDSSDENSYDYIGKAMSIAQEKYPCLLDPDTYNGMTYVFEMICPEARIVTDYGDMEALLLLQVFDRLTYNYINNEDVVLMAQRKGLEYADTLFSAPSVAQGADRLKKLLEGAQSLPEGAIVSFEKEGTVHHRVKVKMAEYLRAHRLRYQCTYDSVVEMLWNRPQMWHWETFLEELKVMGLTDEEAVAFYQQYFEEFMAHVAEVQERLVEAKAWISDHGVYQKGEDFGAYMKCLAIKTKTERPEIMALTMHLARKGEPTQEDLFRMFAPCDSFGAIRERAKAQRNDAEDLLASLMEA